MSWHKQLPDYSIQEVEQAEYQNYHLLGNFSVGTHPIYIAVIALLLFLAYRKVSYDQGL